MSLAHEITMDSDFKLEPSNKDEEGLLQKVKETMHAAFWDLQRQKLEADPPDYSSALELLKEIKSSLVDMILPYQSSLRAQINDKLDVAAAEAQIAETGRFDLASYATPIIDIMATWCAPARDADVARLRDITDSVDFLKRVFEILEQMHMDLANFTIEKMRPYIRQHAAVYEREKFDQCLEAQKKAGVDGLSRTRQWLQEAFEKLCANTTTSPVLSSPCSSNAPSPFAPAGFGSPTTPAVSHPAPPPPTPNNILREAYLNLLTWDAENEFPETMLVDAGRFEDLSDCLTRTVTLASVILTVCNTVAHNYTVCLPSGQNSLPAGSITRLKETVSNDVRGIFDSTSARKLSNLIDLVTARVLAIVGHWRHRLRKDASTSLEDADRQWAALPNCDLPVELQDQLVKQVTAVLNGEHPVYNLMFNRALDFLRNALSARPPDPLTLPSGFGALSESGGPTGGTSKAVPSCDRLVAGGALRKTPFSAVSAPEGDAQIDLSRTYDLSIIASRLMPLVAHNRHVFGPHYAEIIQGLLLQNQSRGDLAVAPT